MTGVRAIRLGVVLAGVLVLLAPQSASAVISVNSDVQLVAVTPPGAAGAVGIVVTTAGGSVTAAGAFTYVAGPGI